MSVGIKRTYPQPDSPAPNIGPRERAMAVYKYLLDLQPEAAIKHPLFGCIVHAFEQAERAGAIKWNDSPYLDLPTLDTSLVEMLKD